MADASGGIGRHVKALAEGLPERGVELTLCAPASAIAALGLDTVDIRVVAVPLGSSSPAAWWDARRQLKREAAAVDLVHAHGLRAGGFAVAFAQPTPLIVTWHNAPLGGRAWRRIHGMLSRYVARGSDLTFAASEDLATAARSVGALGVHLTFIAAPALQGSRSATQVRADLGIGDRPVVLAVGRLQRQKRLDVLIDAAAPWAADAAAPIVLIAGDGPLRSALAAQIDATRAPVRLLGASEDVAELLAAADVVALPSEWEARSLVAQEALHAGVPLVTTAVGGLPVLLGDAAEFVPVGDPAALRSAIEGLLADPDRRARLAEAGHEHAASWPTAAQSLDTIASEYFDLIARSRLDEMLGG
jgi:glycosyltransferase involved in cell wall biosynthesis